VKINDSLIHAEGSPIQGASYQFIDEDVKNRQTYYYNTATIDLKGTMNRPVNAVPRLIYEIER
jgi:hypothetical protein